MFYPKKAKKRKSIFGIITYILIISFSLQNIVWAGGFSPRSGQTDTIAPQSIFKYLQKKGPKDITFKEALHIWNRLSVIQNVIEEGGSGDVSNLQRAITQAESQIQIDKSLFDIEGCMLGEEKDDENTIYYFDARIIGADRKLTRQRIYFFKKGIELSSELRGKVGIGDNSKRIDYAKERGFWIVETNKKEIEPSPLIPIILTTIPMNEENERADSTSGVEFPSPAKWEARVLDSLCPDQFLGDLENTRDIVEEFLKTKTLDEIIDVINSVNRDRKITKEMLTGKVRVKYLNSGKNKDAFKISFDVAGDKSFECVFKVEKRGKRISQKEIDDLQKLSQAGALYTPKFGTVFDYEVKKGMSRKCIVEEFIEGEGLLRYEKKNTGEAPELYREVARALIWIYSVLSEAPTELHRNNIVVLQKDGHINLKVIDIGSERTSKPSRIMEIIRTRYGLDNGDNGFIEEAVLDALGQEKGKLFLKQARFGAGEERAEKGPGSFSAEPAPDASKSRHGKTRGIRQGKLRKFQKAAEFFLNPYGAKVMAEIIKDEEYGERYKFIIENRIMKQAVILREVADRFGIGSKQAVEQFENRIIEIAESYKWAERPFDDTFNERKSEYLKNIRRSRYKYLSPEEEEVVLRELASRCKCHITKIIRYLEKEYGAKGLGRRTIEAKLERYNIARPVISESMENDNRSRSKKGPDPFSVESDKIQLADGSRIETVRIRMRKVPEITVAKENPIKFKFLLKHEEYTVVRCWGKNGKPTAYFVTYPDAFGRTCIRISRMKQADLVPAEFENKLMESKRKISDEHVREDRKFDKRAFNQAHVMLGGALYQGYLMLYPEEKLNAFIYTKNELYNLGEIGAINLQGVLAGFGYPVAYINSYYRLYKHYLERGLNLSERYGELLEENNNRGLIAFIKLMEEARKKDGGFNLLGERNIEGVLTGFGYSVHYINGSYKLYQHWKQNGVDVDAEYDFSGYDKKLFAAILEKIRKIGLPKGRFTAGIDFYILVVLRSLGKIESSKIIPMDSLPTGVFRKLSFLGADGIEMEVLSEEIREKTGQGDYLRLLELLGSEEADLTSEEKAELDKLINKSRAAIDEHKDPNRSCGTVCEKGHKDNEGTRITGESSLKRPRETVLEGVVNGEGVGVLRIISNVTTSGGELFDIKDNEIVAVPKYPSLGPALARPMGIISCDESSKLSHAMTTARFWGIPHAVTPDLKDLQPFDGKWVYIKVTDEGVQLRLATQAEIDNWKSFRYEPVKPELLRIDLATKRNILNYDRATNPQEVSYKFANLRKAGAENYVHAGSVIPFAVYKRVLDANPGAEEKIRRIIAGINVIGDMHDTMGELFGIDIIINRLNIPEDILSDWNNDENLRWAVETGGGLFVRTGTNAEDLPDFPGFGAGKYSSFANIKAKDIADYVRMAWSSVWSFDAFIERERLGMDHFSVYPAVQISKTIDSDYSFTINTVEPKGNNSDLLMIELIQGLGDGFKEDGKPHAYIYGKRQDRIIDYKPADKKGKIVLDPKGGTRAVPTDYSADVFLKDGADSSLALKLARAAVKIENVFGRPQDIEGAIVLNAGETEYDVHIFQSRTQVGYGKYPALWEGSYKENIKWAGDITESAKSYANNFWSEEAEEFIDKEIFSKVIKGENVFFPDYLLAKRIAWLFKLFYSLGPDGEDVIRLIISHATGLHTYVAYAIELLEPRIMARIFDLAAFDTDKLSESEREKYKGNNLKIISKVIELNLRHKKDIFEQVLNHVRKDTLIRIINAYSDFFVKEQMCDAESGIRELIAGLSDEDRLFVTSHLNPDAIKWLGLHKDYTGTVINKFLSIIRAEAGNCKVQDKDLVIAIDTDIGNLKDYAGELFKALNELQDALGRAGLDNVKIFIGEGVILKAQIDRYLKDAERDNHKFVISAVLKADSLNHKLYESIRDKMQITAVNDTNLENTDNDKLNYVPILSIIELSVKKAMGISASAIKDEYSNLPNVEEILEQNGMLIIYLLPKSKPIQIDDLKERYKNEAQVLISA